MKRNRVDIDESVASDIDEIITIRAKAGDSPRHVVGVAVRRFLAREKRRLRI